MVSMEKVLLQQIDNQYLGNLPEEYGGVSFWKGEELLFATETINLKHTVRVIFALQEEDSEIRDMLTQADSVAIEQTTSGLEALIQTRALLARQTAEFNQRIQLWKNYVYLAINPAEFPFVKITEFTDEDWFYLGPFRSRFFLTDLMELMHKLLKLPHCEVKAGPCEKLGEGICRGWCQLIKAEAAATDEADGHPQLEKLDALLKEAFVHPDNGLLDLVTREKQKYEKDLQFVKADLLKTELELLKRYKEWLVFLYKIKNLNKVTDRISIKGGQLIRFRIDGLEQELPFVKIPYRPNELLAINKNLLEEARILYKECQ
jgi:excinuclease ABC subunit C